MRVVLDLNVVVSGLISARGTSGETLRAVLEERLEVVVCPKWIAEALGVTARAEFRDRFSEAQAEAVIRGIVALAESRADPIDPPRATRDPDDDYLVALALDSGCDALVSGDKDLVEYPGPPEVLPPRALLDRLADA